MSSVPAPRIERLPLSPRTEGPAPDPTAASLRLVPQAVELYPSLFAGIRAAFNSRRAHRALGDAHESADLGRATGVRV